MKTYQHQLSTLVIKVDCHLAYPEQNDNWKIVTFL